MTTFTTCGISVSLWIDDSGTLLGVIFTRDHVSCYRSLELEHTSDGGLGADDEDWAHACDKADVPEAIRPALRKAVSCLWQIVNAE